MDRASPRVLLIGEVDHREFQDAIAWLRAHAELTAVGTVDEAIQLSGVSKSAWHTVIFAQSRPGRFSPRAVRRVGRALPLAHYIALLGTLCDGQRLQQDAWPGVTRVYWHEFVARCASELQLDLLPTSWQLPRTASEAERTETLIRASQVAIRGMAVVFTRNGALYDAIAAACRRVGLASVWSTNERRPSFCGAVAAIWDATGPAELDAHRLEWVTGQSDSVPVIVLMAFPRWEQVQRARAAGAQAVLSSPLMIPDLWNALRRAANRSASRQTPDGVAEAARLPTA